MTRVENADSGGAAPHRGHRLGGAVGGRGGGGAQGAVAASAVGVGHEEGPAGEADEDPRGGDRGEFGGLAQRRALAGEFIERLRNVLPGEAGGASRTARRPGRRAEASGATAASALRRMWALVASDRWVVFVGFASLVGAAVMAISGFDLCCCRVLVDGSNAVTCGCGCSSRRSRYPISSQRPYSRRRTEGLCSTGTLSFWLFCV